MTEGKRGLRKSPHDDTTPRWRRGCCVDLTGAQISHQVRTRLQSNHDPFENCYNISELSLCLIFLPGHWMVLKL